MDKNRAYLSYLHVSLRLHLQNIIQLLTLKVRLFLFLTSLSALFFIETYCSSVCSFIDGLGQYELVLNLSAIFIFQLLVRELLYRTFSKPWKRVTLVRQAYYLSILSWIIAGIGASLLHFYRYPYFPAGSHLKLLSSYWILGGGVLAQLEYVVFEHYYKALSSDRSNHLFKERISRRILESLIIFTLAPTITMLLTVMRYNYEGVLDKHVTTELLYIGLLSIAAAITVAFLIGKMLKKDTKQIITSVKAVASGDFTTQINIHRPDELGEIAEGINEMSQGLRLREQIKEAFGRFVNPQVAATFIDKFVKDGEHIKMGGQKQYVVILMADLRDFTALSETMEPDALITLLNAYFSAMVEVIHSEGGVVDKFMGDAIMAVFGLADTQDPESATLRAAIKMRSALEQLNIKFKKEGKPQLDNGIGIHSGEVIAGYLGSQERLEFTVIGSAVNVTSRIEEQTKVLSKNILISEMTVEKIDKSLKTSYVETLQLKGVSEEIRLYTAIQ